MQYGQYIGSKANELLNKAESYMKEYEDYISMEHILLLWILMKQHNNL